MKAEKVISDDNGWTFREQDIVKLNYNIESMFYGKEVIGRIVEINIDKNTISLDCSSQYNKETISTPLSFVNDIELSRFGTWEDEYNKIATQAVEVTKELNEEIQKLKREIETLKQEND